MSGFTIVTVGRIVHVLSLVHMSLRIRVTQFSDGQWTMICAMNDHCYYMQGNHSKLQTTSLNPPYFSPCGGGGGVKLEGLDLFTPVKGEGVRICAYPT